MICPNCQKNIKDDSIVCESCGYLIPEEKIKNEDTIPLLTIKSTFIPLCAIISSLHLIIFFTTIGGIIIGHIVNLILEKMDIHINLWQTYVTFGFLLFITLPFYFYIMKKINYLLTDYNFYKNKLVITNKWKKSHNTIIYYYEIDNVLFESTFYQNTYNLGNIILIREEKILNEKIILPDIECYDKVFNLVKSIIENGK